MRIGALTIGHSPRQDLMRLTQGCMPTCEVVEVGALDFISEYDVPCGMTDPTDVLTTRLCDGSRATLDRTFLSPLLQQALNHLEQSQIDAIALLSSGDFPRLRSYFPLIKPFEITCKHLRSQRARRIGVAVPFPEQEDTSRLKWAAYGFDATVWVMPQGATAAEIGSWLYQQTELTGPVDAIVIDDVRYAPVDVMALKAYAPAHTLDMGDMAMQAVQQRLALA